MSTTVYPALVTGDQAGGYHAELVDFPGATVEGEGPGVLLGHAREALLAELRRLGEAGRDWPSPTPVEKLSQRLKMDGAAVLFVDVQVEETPVRVNISIGEGLLRRLDDAAQALNMTRSGYIASAVRLKLAGAEAGAAGAGPGLREELSEFGRRLNQALGPESAFSRAVADLDGRAMESLRTLGERLGGGRRGAPRRDDGA